MMANTLPTPYPTPGPKPQRYPSSIRNYLEEQQTATSLQRKATEAGRQLLGAFYPTKPGEILSVEELKAKLREMGIDPDDPQIALALQDTTTRQFLSNPVNFSAWVQEFSSKQSEYWAQRMLYFPQSPFGTRAEVSFETMPTRAAMAARAAAEGLPYVMDDSGAILYKNGALVTPDGTVLLPEGDDSVPGSRAWLAKVQQEWSPERVKAEKATLVQYGYLDKKQAKTGTWDRTFYEALRQFYLDKYANFGQPLPLEGSPLAGGGAGASRLPDLDQIKASVELDVTSTYRQLYGVDPKPEEVHAWSRFVIGTAEKLMRKAGLTPSQAIEEGESRMIKRFTSSPAGEFVKLRDENTQLRDSFIAAVLATRAIMGS